MSTKAKNQPDESPCKITYILYDNDIGLLVEAQHRLHPVPLLGVLQGRRGIRGHIERHALTSGRKEGEIRPVS